MPRPRGAPMTPEHKAKMMAGRQRWVEAKKAAANATAAGMPVPSTEQARERQIVGVVLPKAEFDRKFDGPDIERFDDETEALIAENLITRDEVYLLRAEARAKVEAERKAAARKRLLDRMVTDHRDRVGMTPAKDARRRWLDELVDIQINLPVLKSPNSRVPNYPDPIRIDGHIFANGRNYRVTRAQAQTLLSMMGLARKHAAQVEGESPAYYDARRQAFSYMGGVPAGSGGAGLSSPTMERRGSA